ncbi:MAG: hypothetical protein ACOWYE_09940 [Desulfatiglandales bacterium]
MTTMDERESKIQLFGKLGLIDAKGGHPVPVYGLHRPLEWERGVIRYFCEGCGSIFELKQSQALRFVLRAGARRPNSWEGLYFHGRACGVCDGLDRFIELRPIPEV